MVKVAALNLLDGFSHEDRIETIVDQIDRIDPDVAVFPEAYAEGQEQFLGEVKERFAALGYVASRTLYNDDDGRLDRHGLVVVNRLNGDQASVWRLGTRNALLAKTGEFAVLGVHFDDRYESRRLAQARAAIGPEAIVGDLNSVARRFGPARAATLLPARFPTEERPKVAKWERVCNIAHRTGAMIASRTHACWKMRDTGIPTQTIKPHGQAGCPCSHLTELWQI